MAKTVVGLFDNYVDAQNAVQDLLSSGYDRKYVSVVANDVVRHPSVVVSEASEAETHMTDSGVAQGAGAGAVAGGIAGLIVGLGAMAVPGIGPLLVVGPLAGMLIGAGLGLVVGGLLGALIDVGVPQQEAEYYAEGVRRGGTLVILQAADIDAERSMDILDRHNAVDVEERAAQWRVGGWTAYNPKAEAYTADEIAREREAYARRSPEPYLPAADAVSNITPAYQAGVPVPPVSVAPADVVETGANVADVPPPNAPNPWPPIGRRPVRVYPYTGTVAPIEDIQEPPMPMETLRESERDLVGAKGGEADTVRNPMGRADDYQNSDLGGEVSVYDPLERNP
ncbi:MAG TPA: general stress protein [Capsulimonadaceae bacterium]|nr:general stress protein [Capsulimonadaceae bacterium]